MKSPGSFVTPADVKAASKAKQKLAAAETKVRLIWDDLQTAQRRADRLRKQTKT